MKIMQILDGFCYYDATETARTHDLSGLEGITLVEAPDYVFPGWGFDETREGDARFIKPTQPEGWLYDEKTGTFYQEGYQPPMTPEERIASLEAENRRKDAQIAALSEQNDFHEELIVELANVVYA